MSNFDIIGLFFQNKFWRPLVLFVGLLYDTPVESFGLLVTNKPKFCNNVFISSICVLMFTGYMTLLLIINAHQKFLNGNFWENDVTRDSREPAVRLSYGLVALVVLTDRTSGRQLAELVETIEHRAVLTNID